MTPQPLKWIKLAHSYKESSIFHFNKPFEVWLLDILNNTKAVNFRILPPESHNEDETTQVVLFHVPENVEVTK